MKRQTMEVRDASATFAPMLDVPVVPAGYKQTEVGVIPEDWEAFKFNDHFTIYAGGDVPKVSFSPIESEKHPFPVFANALQKKGLYGFTDQKRSAPDSLTITARGYLGHAEYRVEPFFPIVRLLVLEPLGTLDAKFATYAVNDRVQFAIESTGVPQLTAPQVGRYAIAAPGDVKEQRAIATALSDVDALLEALDRLIAKKRDIKQATMQQLLTGQTRLSGFKGEWEDKPLGKIGKFLKGSGITREEAQTGNLPCVRYGEIYTLHDGMVREFYSWISEAVAQTAVRVQKGDILFAGSGETKEEIGKCVAITNDVEAYAGGDIVILRTRFADPKFLGYALNQPSVNLQKSRLGQGDAVVHVSASSLSQVIIGLPPLPEQEAISSILIDMDTEIYALERRRAKTAALKQAMMQELLTGRTRLVNPGCHESRGDKLNSNKSKANVHFMRSVFAAEIVNQLHQEPTFGHVKFEKVLFLAEHLCDVDTGSTYHRKAAGPYDNRALRSIDSQIRKQQWFEARKEKGRYRYIPLDKRGGHKEYFDRYFFHVNYAFRKVVEIFRTLDTERCEIVATLFSAWDDLLHKQATVSDEMIVHEVLNNWHDSKQRIAEGRWLNALEWMREKGLVPKAVSSPGSDSRVVE